jgi:hypothetical protein
VTADAASPLFRDQEPQDRFNASLLIRRRRVDVERNRRLVGIADETVHGVFCDDRAVAGLHAKPPIADLRPYCTRRDEEDLDAAGKRIAAVWTPLAVSKTENVSPALCTFFIGGFYPDAEGKRECKSRN